MESEKLDTIDWNDSNKVFAFGVGTVDVARDYQAARKTFANSLKTLKMGLANAYRTHKIDPKIAEEKAYLILANENPEMREALSNKIESEHEYKGLEKVLDTRQAVTSLAQSLIKNKIEST